MMLNIIKLMEVSSETVVWENNLAVFYKIIHTYHCILQSPIYPRKKNMSALKIFSLNLKMAVPIKPQLVKQNKTKNKYSSVHEWVNIVIYHLAIKRSQLLLHSRYQLISNHDTEQKNQVQKN